MKKAVTILLLFAAMAGGVYLEQRFHLIDAIDALLSRSGTGNGETAVAETGSGTERKILYWVAPMNPNFRSDKPGKSPMGMDLIPVYEDDGEEADAVRIAPEVINNLGVRTAQAERGELSRRIDTVGYIDYDETKISHVHLRTDGWIHQLTVDYEQERLKKGELLFTLYSPTLVNAQEEFLQAAASGNKALTEASAERLLALGLNRAQIDNLRKTGKPAQYVATYAGQSGVVSALNVRDGMYVKPETEIMSISGLDTIWIEVEVFERQAGWVKTGQPAEARIPALPDRAWKGSVDYVYPELDPVTRTLRVRLRFENPEELLKPNMYADVSILSDASGAVIHIPQEALIRTGRSERVILALGDGRFRPAEVRSGIESGDRVEIIEGLSEGERVVTSGQFLIDSEASLDASFLRMLGGEETAGSPQHDHTQTAGPQEAASGHGTVKAVEERMLTLTHGPIDALGWPAMTMDFTVAEDIDIGQVKVGDAVDFHLAKRGDGTFIITNIVPVQHGDMENNHD